MKKSNKSPLTETSDKEDITSYYKEAALDSLLYWTNSTVELSGISMTLTLLTEMLATCVTRLVPSSQAGQVEEVVFKILKEAFAASKQDLEESSQVISTSSDKKNMN